MNSIFDQLKIGTYNVRGKGKKQKRDAISIELSKLNLNIVCIQETHVKDNTTWKNEWKFHFPKFESWSANGSNNSRGGVILINKNWIKDNDIKIKKIQKDIDGRWIFLKLHKNDLSFSLINVYAEDKIGNKEQWWKEITKIWNNWKINCICGDFNIDLNNLNKYENFQNFIIKKNLTDGWKIRNPTLKQTTW